MDRIDIRKPALSLLMKNEQLLISLLISHMETESSEEYVREKCFRGNPMRAQHLENRATNECAQCHRVRIVERKSKIKQSYNRKKRRNRKYNEHQQFNIS